MATVLEPAPVAPDASRPGAAGDHCVSPPPALDRGLLGMDLHGRSQEARHPLRSDGLLLLPGRRGRGVAHPTATGAAQRPGAVGQRVQPGVHHARHHDDLPRDHAAVGGTGQLHGPPPDRCPGRRLPPHECLQLLAVPLGRGLPVLQLPVRWRAERWLVRLRPQHQHHRLPAGPGHGLLGVRPAAARHRLDRRLGQPRRDRAEHAGSGHEPAANADLHVDDAHLPAAHALCHAGHHRGVVPDDVRPQLRVQLLQSRPGR